MGKEDRDEFPLAHILWVGESRKQTTLLIGILALIIVAAILVYLSWEQIVLLISLLAPIIIVTILACLTFRR